MPRDLQEHPDETPDRGVPSEVLAGPAGGSATGAAVGAATRAAGLPSYDGDGRPVGPDLTSPGVGGDRPRPGDPDSVGTGSPGVLAVGPAELARLRLVREVALVARAMPDEALQVWADALDPETAPVEIVVEAVAAAVRLESAARARTVALAAALARRPEMDPAWGRANGPVPQHRSVAADELAMRLGTSRVAANRLVHEGQVLDLCLPATGHALASGQVDAAKASLLVRRLGDLPAEVAEPVEDLVLPGAGDRSLSQLRIDVERALIQVDPDGATGRHERAQDTRTVTRPRPEADGMASMWLVLAAEDAAAVDGVLEHSARAARAAGDGRTLTQLRADGLRDLVVGDVALPEHPAELREALALLAGHHAAATAGTGSSPGVPMPRPRPDAATADDAGCRCGGARRAGAQVRVTIHASTLLGLDDQPADLEGHGPIDPVTARALAAGGTWQRIITDPESETVLDVGRTRYRPRAALDEHVRVRDRHCAAPGCTIPATRADVDHTLEYRRQNSRPRHGKGVHPPAGPGRAPAPGTQRASGNAGTTDLPATPGNRAVFTTRVALDNPHPVAAATDLGTTAAHNLGVLCRRHHRLKTDGGFRLRQIAPGLYLWVTPGGHIYLTRPGTDQVADITTRIEPVDPEHPPF